MSNVIERQETGPAAEGTEIEVRNAAVIGGRGAVLIGYVTRGRPVIGQVTAPIVFGGAIGRRLELIRIERLSSMESGRQAVGLIFRDAPSLVDFNRALPAGTALLLTPAAL